MVLVALVIVIPVMLGLGPELTTASQNVANYARANQAFFMEKAASVPYVGDFLAERLSTLPSETGEIGSLLLEFSGTLLGTASLAAQGAVWLVFNVSFFFLAVFFLFYYGETLLRQLDAAMFKMDATTERYTLLVERTVTGVLYGLVFTAIAQGFLAGLGFAMVGVRAPVLLGLATALLSFVPVGPPMIYLPVALSLFLNGAPIRGLLLAIWGVVLVSSADNILKPYFISRQAELPFPLVLLGVSGGLLAFGVIGVFVGPVVVGLVLALWQGWLEPEEQIEPEETAGVDEPPEIPEEEDDDTEVVRESDQVEEVATEPEVASS